MSGWNNLAALPVEPGVPLGEEGARTRCELHARVLPSPQLLPERMEAHRHEVPEDLVLVLHQRPVGFLVLDVKAVVVPVLRQTPVTQQCSNQCILLSRRQLARAPRTSLGVILPALEG